MNLNEKIIGFAEEALIASNSEMKRPIAALNSLAHRHAVHVQLSVGILDGNVMVRAQSDSGCWTARRWLIEVPFDAIESGACGVDRQAAVYVSSGDGTGTYKYTMSARFAGWYMRQAIIRLGEFIAVTELGDPHIYTGGYLETDAVVRRTRDAYYQIGYKRIVPEPDESEYAEIHWTVLDPATLKPPPEADPVERPDEDNLADWERELLEAQEA